MTVDIYGERFHDRGFLVLSDREDHPILVRFWQSELPVEGLVRKDVLVKLVAVLIFDSDDEPASPGIVITDVEDEHILLCPQEFDGCRIRGGYRRGAARLGIRRGKCQKRDDAKA